jgi:hypothetical protein
MPITCAEKCRPSAAVKRPVPHPRSTIVFTSAHGMWRPMASSHIVMTRGEMRRPSA